MDNRLKTSDGRDPFRTVPVLRPLLPDAASIMPYLERIDASRIYSNFGPLSLEFAGRVAEALAVQQESVLPVSCGTTGLIAAILAVANYDSHRSLALMPSFTFAATAVAAERCGLRPHFLDVDAESLQLDPRRLRESVVLNEVAVVIVVAPFGRPPRQAEWIAFQQQTGIPVVFDCAASFAVIGSQSQDFLGQIPTVFSFHATKSFGIGEGGCVVCTASDISMKMTATVNFGFYGARESLVPSINGKISEYAAAIGLAALDGWKAKLNTIARVATTYRTAFLEAGLAERFCGWPDIDGNYALYRTFNNEEHHALVRFFEAEGIEYRLWYGSGLHRQTRFAGLEREELPVTESICENLIGIPMAPDLSEESIWRIVRAAAAAKHDANQ